MTKIFVLSLVCCGLWPLSLCAAAQPNRPHVLLILVDDLGFSDLGCYGGEIETPHLDRLAAGGLRFTQFYNTARCWPTRAALLTGYYAQQIRRDKLPGGKAMGSRPLWARLLPDLLRPRGYRSYHSGKWHIDGKVLAGGFDRSLELTRGTHFSGHQNRIDDRPVEPGTLQDTYYGTTAIADHAVACLREHAEAYASRPFFHYVAFYAPHFPLHALPEDIARYRDRYLCGWDELRQQRYARQKRMGLVQTPLSAMETDLGPPYDFPDAFEKLGPGELNRPIPWTSLNPVQQRFQATKMAIHAAMVDRVDQEIGRLIKQLRAMQAFENTLILFASDNGASAEIMVRHGGHDPEAAPGSAATYLCLGPGFSSAANTPFRRHKTWVHEGGISTPLVAHWPAGIQARGELRHTPAHVIDVVPTILELAGIDKPKQWQGKAIPPAPGRGLVPAFRQDVVVDRDLLWWLHDGHRAIRVGHWKLVAAQGDPWELYDMRGDRAESRDLAAAHPERVDILAGLWEQQVEDFGRLVQDGED